MGHERTRCTVLQHDWPVSSRLYSRWHCKDELLLSTFVRLNRSQSLTRKTRTTWSACGVLVGSWLSGSPFLFEPSNRQAMTRTLLITRLVSFWRHSYVIWHDSSCNQGAYKGFRRRLGDRRNDVSKQHLRFRYQRKSLSTTGLLRIAKSS